jgi:hypothetical protein
MPGLHHLRPDEKRWSSLRWVELLDKAARSPDQESIMHAAEYAVCHEARASEAVEAWKRRAGLCEAQGEPAVGLSLLYIANDVLQRFRDSHSLLQAFTDKLPELVWRLYACAKRERSAQTAQSILSLVCSTHPSMLTPGLVRSCPPRAHLQSVEPATHSPPPPPPPTAGALERPRGLLVSLLRFHARFLSALGSAVRRLSPRPRDAAPLPEPGPRRPPRQLRLRAIAPPRRIGRRHRRPRSGASPRRGA